jgi:outer membrane protein W
MKAVVFAGLFATLLQTFGYTADSAVLNLSELAQNTRIAEDDGLLYEKDTDSGNTDNLASKPLRTKSAKQVFSNRVILEGRVSYFYPFSKDLRKMFHNGGVNYALNLFAPVWGRLNMWAAVDYFSRSGKMINFDTSTHITIVPLTLGLQYIHPFNKIFGIHGGAGMRYFFVEGINRSSVVNRKIDRSGLGGVFELGFLFCATRHLVFDVFSSFSLKKLDGPGHTPPNVVSNDVQVGGWNIGAGIGYKF